MVRYLHRKNFLTVSFLTDLGLLLLSIFLFVLAADYPDTVVAYKDSSGDFDNTKAIVAAAPDISVFPGASKMKPNANA